MSRYRRVLTRIWEDDKFPTMPCEARLLFLYHLTSPRSTPFLLYVEGFGAIGDALRLPSTRLRAAAARLREHEMVWYGDDDSNLIFLPNAMRIPENGPESRNAVTSWWRLLRDLPRTPFFSRCLGRWARYASQDVITHPLTKAFLEGIDFGLAIQEQEQERSSEGSPQEQEQEQEKGKASEMPSWPSPERLVALYNELAADECPAVEKLTPARRKKALAYLKSFPEESFWREAFAASRQSRLLRGLNNRPGSGHEHFVATFDWYLSVGKDGAENVAKTYEGKYRG